MRAMITPLIAIAGLIIELAGPVQAAPAIPQDLGVAAPAITLVRQRCGHGFHREKAWQDKGGAWHGKCVPNPPKQSSAR